MDLKAQQRTVSGKVVLEDGSTIPGVNILVKETSRGTVTDVNGNYSIGVDEGDVLIFSFIGLVTQEVAVGNRTVINTTMEEDVQNLEEVVVVGYGEQKKATLTTAISTITGDELNEYPVADLGQALQGRAAGVNITNNGSPGGRTLIRIRGLSTFGDGDPLVVVDGVFLEDSEDLRNINPASVEKIDVLKDAAATA
ncbi:MAG: TonB-dependent receptor plug domain-containing protein, partial [Cyclobacteriaceae bacterium]